MLARRLPCTILVLTLAQSSSSALHDPRPQPRSLSADSLAPSSSPLAPVFSLSRQLLSFNPGPMPGHYPGSLLVNAPSVSVGRFRFSILSLPVRYRIAVSAFLCQPVDLSLGTGGCFCGCSITLSSFHYQNNISAPSASDNFSELRISIHGPLPITFFSIPSQSAGFPLGFGDVFALASSLALPS